MERIVKSTLTTPLIVPHLSAKSNFLILAAPLRCLLRFLNTLPRPLRWARIQRPIVYGIWKRIFTKSTIERVSLRKSKTQQRPPEKNCTFSKNNLWGVNVKPLINSRSANSGHTWIAEMHKKMERICNTTRVNTSLFMFFNIISERYFTECLNSSNINYHNTNIQPLVPF